tara:strand:- start:12 stop:779 length:768 start_codon:yes stop_codon:yes gene_type:complete
MATFCIDFNELHDIVLNCTSVEQLKSVMSDYPYRYQKMVPKLYDMVHNNLTSLELFSGDATISEQLYEVGYKTETLDIRASMNPTICVDFMAWDYKAAFKPGELDFLWASPDCKTWSLAAGGHHRVPMTTKGVLNADALRPKTEYAKLCDKMIIRLIEVIEYLKPRAWIIENPRGYLRHFPPMKEFTKRNHMTTVFYSNYDHRLVKPTDIWSSNYLWPSEKKKTDSRVSIKTLNYDQDITIPYKLINKIFKKLDV